ncbi:MAG TPA: hypothetical protein PLI12_07030 [Acetobacteraceae bacterium]|nr:hypothetical protein [Acetobacteraceae bacterium]
MTLAALTILLAVLGIMLVSAIGVPRIAAFANALIAGLILILTLAVAVAPLNAGGLIAPDRLGAIFGASGPMSIKMPWRVWEFTRTFPRYST